MSEIHNPSNSSKKNFISIIKEELYKQNKSVLSDWTSNAYRTDHEFDIVFIIPSNQIKLASTLMHIAAFCGDLDVVEYLIKKKKCSPTKLQDSCGNVPLHLAALNNSLNVVKYFVDEKNVDPDLKSNCGHTPLHLAAKGGSLQVVKYFVDEKNVALDLKDDLGYTPLHLAALSGSLDVVKCFVDEKNVDPDLKDCFGHTPLHLAAQGGSFQIVKYFVDEKDVALDLKNDYGHTPLHMAAKGGSLEIVKYFVDEKNVDPDLKDCFGHIPLHLAALSGSLDVVKYFVDEKKVALDLKNDYGDTPLYTAARNDKLQVVKYLIDEKKVALDVNDVANLCSVAVEMSFEKVAEYLLTKVTQPKEGFNQLNSGDAASITVEQLQEGLSEKIVELKGRKTLIKEEKNDSLKGTGDFREGGMPQEQLSEKVQELTNMKIQLTEKEKKIDTAQRSLANIEKLKNKNKELNGKNEKFLRASTHSKRQGYYASGFFVLSGASAVGASLTMFHLATCISLIVATLTFLAVGCYCLCKANTALSNVEVENSVDSVAVEV